MLRRDFLVRAGGAIGVLGAPGLAAPTLALSAPADRPEGFDAQDWESVRAQFELDPKLVHMAGFFLASHPRSVRQAIEAHRARLDVNPVRARHDDERPEGKVLATAAEYLGVRANEIALTDSTTMGLGLMYAGIKLRAGQEILQTTHDHYSTNTSLDFRAARTGATVRRIALYQDAARAGVDEIVGAIRGAITPATRVLAVTWVHSCSGVRLPLAEIGRVVADANRAGGGRTEEDRLLFCVDGVHGLGAVEAKLPDFGCDFFVAGTHKWMFGPRGTGIWWGREGAWAQMDPMIPPFGAPSGGSLFTPGGFHSFEHRWALDEAFRFHLEIGKARVAERIRELNRAIKEGLSGMAHVDLHTPMDDSLAAGIVCFDVKGMRPVEVVERLAAGRIVGSESPYQPSCARLSAGLWTNEAGVEAALRAVAELA